MQSIARRRFIGSATACLTLAAALGVSAWSAADPLAAAAPVAAISVGDKAARAAREAAAHERAARVSVQRVDSVLAARAAAAQATAERVAAEQAAAAEAARIAAEQAAAAAAAAIAARQAEQERASRAAARVGAPRDIARALLAERGMGEDQFGCLDRLWTRESNWQVTADNPSSSAYGIPQALPGSRMASAGPDWETNPATQITWGLDYIAERYGTPCSAWGASESKGWY